MSIYLSRPAVTSRSCGRSSSKPYGTGVRLKQTASVTWKLSMPSRIDWTHILWRIEGRQEMMAAPRSPVRRSPELWQCGRPDSSFPTHPLHQTPSRILKCFPVRTLDLFMYLTSRGETGKLLQGRRFRSRHRELEDLDFDGDLDRSGREGLRWYEERCLPNEQWEDLACGWRWSPGRLRGRAIAQNESLGRGSMGIRDRRGRGVCRGFSSGGRHSTANQNCSTERHTQSLEGTLPGSHRNPPPKTSR